MTHLPSSRGHQRFSRGRKPTLEWGALSSSYALHYLQSHSLGTTDQREKLFELVLEAKIGQRIAQTEYHVAYFEKFGNFVWLTFEIFKDLSDTKVTQFEYQHYLWSGWLHRMHKNDAKRTNYGI